MDVGLCLICVRGLKACRDHLCCSHAVTQHVALLLSARIHMMGLAQAHCLRACRNLGFEEGKAETQS